MKRVSSFFLFVFLCLLSLPSLASDEPVVSLASHTLTQSDIAPSPQQLESWRDDPMVATRREMHNFKKVVEFIQQQFVVDYAQNNGLAANPEFVNSFKAAFGNETLKGDKLDKLAEYAALEFAVDAHLYAIHGGRVVFEQSHPMLPIEAYFTAFKDYAEKKTLVFYDNKMEKIWWLSFTRPTAIEVASENVNFTAPWWHRLD